MQTPKGMPLADLVAPDLSVTLRGKLYKVNPMDGFGYQLMDGMTKETSISIMYRVAAHCLLGQMAREDVYGTEDKLGLTAEEVGLVLGVASGQITSVKATVPNDGKAAAEKGEESNSSLSPESHPTIQLAS